MMMVSKSYQSYKIKHVILKYSHITLCNHNQGVLGFWGFGDVLSILTKNVSADT
jgi:hypothetical protein